MENHVLQQGVPELESPAEKHKEAIPTQKALRKSSRPAEKLKFNEAFPIAHVAFDTEPFLTHAEYQDGSLENLALAVSAELAARIATPTNFQEASDDL